jgi:hypothetical protein
MEASERVLTGETWLICAEKQKRLDISFPVADFKRMCMEWAQFNGNMNGLCTIHTRRYDIAKWFHWV